MVSVTERLEWAAAAGGGRKLKNVIHDSTKRGRPVAAQLPVSRKPQSCIFDSSLTLELHRGSVKKEESAGEPGNGNGR